MLVSFNHDDSCSQTVTTGFLLEPWRQGSPNLKEIVILFQSMICPEPSHFIIIENTDVVLSVVMSFWRAWTNDVLACSLEEKIKHAEIYPVDFFIHPLKTGINKTRTHTKKRRSFISSFSFYFHLKTSWHTKETTVTIKHQIPKRTQALKTHLWTGVTSAALQTESSYTIWVGPDRVCPPPRVVLSHTDRDESEASGFKGKFSLF